MAPRVLLLRALGLGDLLTAVPAIRALRRAMPEAHLALAAPAGLEPLVGLLPELDELLPTAARDEVAPPWRPDLAVNLHGRGPESHRALLRSAPRRLVAFADDEAGVDGPVWREEHEAERWCRLLRESLGVVADPTDGLLDAAPPTDRTGALVVHPGAASPARRWPAERYAEVARSLAGHGEVVVTGGPGEEALAEEVARGAGLPSGRVLAGRTDLSSLAGLVAHAGIVISGDTGVAHLAAAYARPAVALFGPTPPRWWAPVWGRTRVLWRGTAPGDPHGEVPDPSLLALSVAEVWEAVLGALADARVS